MEQPLKQTTEKITSPERNEEFMSQLPHTDMFIQLMQQVFVFSRIFGIRTYGGNITIGWCTAVMLLLAIVEISTLWKLGKTIAGMTIFSSGSRSIVARFSGTIFYGNAVLSLLIFWRFSSGWKRLSRDWSMAERTLGTNFPVDRYLKTKFVVVVVTVAVFTVVEHGMSMYSNIIVEWTNTTEIFRHYVINSHAFLIIPSDYTTILGLLLFISGKLGTILWNFQDMIIILFSVGLASRYRRLNKHVEQIVEVDKVTAHITDTNAAYIKLSTWRKIRESYVRQAALVRKVDSELGGLILLSNANNFYFICLQVFNGLGGENLPLVSKVYYFTSMLWLCARACAVVLAAADINVQSRHALKCLLKCPDRCFNIEMDRLEKQLSQDFVALSGMGFYYLNRILLLEVAANIIKYELVLLEMDYGS